MASSTTTFTLSITSGIFEPLFPEFVNYGSSGGPGWNTAVIETDGGAEERTARWSEARRRYNAAFGIKSQDQLQEIREFYMAQQGALGEFRFKDWSEYSSTENGITNIEKGNVVTPTDVVLGVADGIRTAFQLIKKYEDPTKTQIRNIYKPRSGTVLIAFDGVEQLSGWSVDTTTGIILFTVAPPDTIEVTAGFEFDVPCRFAGAADDQLKITVEAFEAGSLTIPLLEVRNSQTVQSDFYYGGGSDLDIAADTVLSLAMGRSIRLDSQAIPNLEIILPLVADLEPGGPYFYLTNRGTNVLRVVPVQSVGPGLELGNLSQGDTMIVLLADDGGTKTWYAL